MKKAKFNDNFKLTAGACIGHYLQSDNNCKNCLLKEQCIERANNKNYPNSHKQVLQIIKKLKSPTKNIKQNKIVKKKYK